MIHRIRFSRPVYLSALLSFVALWATGCSPTQPFYFHEDGDLSHYVGMATNIEYPDSKTCSIEISTRWPSPVLRRS